MKFFGLTDAVSQCRHSGYFCPQEMQQALVVFLACPSLDCHLQDMPKPLQPNFILDVEMSELFIQAGLQDRVIQVSTRWLIAQLSWSLCPMGNLCVAIKWFVVMFASNFHTCKFY